jgi:hypothetical protein
MAAIGILLSFIQLMNEPEKKKVSFSTTKRVIDSVNHAKSI